MVRGADVGVIGWSRCGRTGQGMRGWAEGRRPLGGSGRRPAWLTDRGWVRGGCAARPGVRASSEVQRDNDGLRGGGPAWFEPLRLLGGGGGGAEPGGLGARVADPHTPLCAWLSPACRTPSRDQLTSPCPWRDPALPCRVGIQQRTGAWQSCPPVPGVGGRSRSPSVALQRLGTSRAPPGQCWNVLAALGAQAGPGARGPAGLSPGRPRLPLSYQSLSARFPPPQSHTAPGTARGLSASSQRSWGGDHLGMTFGFQAVLGWQGYRLRGLQEWQGWIWGALGSEQRPPAS